MKRLILPLAVFALVGCSDQALSPDGETPTLAVSDGAHQGSSEGDACADGSPTWPQCQGTFFMTPIVESPEFTGTPNGNLLPEVVITELPLVDGEIDDSQAACVFSNEVRRFSEIAADPTTGEYSVGWNTGEDELTDSTVLRICVRIPRGGGTFTEMAYRDVMPVSGGAEVPRNVAQLPIYQFNNGRNIPISFVILNGTLCGLEDNIDCTEGLLGADGGTLVCDDGQCGLSVPPGALNEPTLLFVELLNCEDVGGPAAHLGIDVDVPIGPGCLEVSGPDVGTVTFDEASGGAIVGACVDLGAFALQGSQDELLQILHARPDGVAEFLPQVPFPSQLDCQGFTQTAEAAHPLLKLARGGLRAVQRTLLPWVNPEPLHAIDQGFGGGKTLVTSPFVWGLPSQFERGMWDGSQFVASWTDPEIGQVGGTLMPAVRVLDGGDPTCDPTAGTCFERSPVENARVRFEVTAGGGSPLGEQPVFTGSNGVAYLNWTLGEDNPNIAEARGVGIGCVEFDDDLDGTDDCEIRDGSPPPSADGTGIFGDNDFGEDPFQRLRVDIATGVISFEALACAPGATVDGVFAAGEYPVNNPANQQSFMAQLSGGEVPATLYWTNDCDNLYIALVVETTDVEDNVSLRLVFDNDADGVPAADDDVLFLEKVVDKKSKTSSWVFRDHYLTADCLNSTQSSCSAADVSDGGTEDGQGAFGTIATHGVYEISHPLRSDDPNHDFQLDLGDITAYYAALQLGNGSKGNTEVLDFREYIQVVITADGGF